MVLYRTGIHLMRNNGVVKVMVTGASGYIGQSLCRFLDNQGLSLVGVVRRKSRNELPNIDFVEVSSISELSFDLPVSRGVDTVVHMAAQAHVPYLPFKSGLRQEIANDAHMAEQLAASAGQAGVRRFVFISTAKVLGESSPPDSMFSNSSTPAPMDIYAKQKRVAEIAIASQAKRFGMEYVVIRPAMVYGGDVKGNLKRLLRWVDSGFPLPYGGLSNQRSMVSQSDLNSLIYECISNPAVVDANLLAAGDDFISTPEICMAFAEGLGRSARLINMPKWAWAVMTRMPVVAGVARKLSNSFRIDNTTTKQLTGWQPRVNVREGLQELAFNWKKRNVG